MSTLVSLPGATPAAAPDYQSLERPLNFTESAAAKVKSLIQEEGNPDLALRVYIEGGGCSGLSYNLDFDNEEQKGDQFFEDNGVKICLDIKSYLYLAGTELDYSDGLNGKGFEFHNPNASRTCACGESFSV